MLVKLGDVDVIPGQDGALLADGVKLDPALLDLALTEKVSVGPAAPKYPPRPEEYPSDEWKKSVDQQRRYLPTLSDLVDRLAIVQLKAINIPEHAQEYQKERADIEHDIDLILQQKEIKLDSTAIHAVLVIMLANHYIWINESKARAGGADQDRLLKVTHSINGVRNSAKNQLAVVDGGRKDFKVDCFAAELVEDFGNWQIFGV
jgi:hypothetical protein